MSERDFSAQAAAPAGQQRVVVTGVGAVTPLGTDLEGAWSRILAGDSAVGPVTRFDASTFATNFAAEGGGDRAHDFDAGH